MIIKTRKLSPKEVKKKLHDFIDDISDECGPEIEEMAEELKAHGDEFIDALSGKGNQRGGNYRGSMGRAWHRNEGTWEEREELRKKNEKKLQELDRQMQELKQQLMQDM